MWFKGLGDNVRVEDDHSKLAGSIGLLSRLMLSVIPPNLRPSAANSEPIFRRLGGATASSRILRISASVLRPFCAARDLRARCVFSEILRIVTAGIAWHLSMQNDIILL